MHRCFDLTFACFRTLAAAVVALVSTGVAAQQTAASLFEGGAPEAIVARLGNSGAAVPASRFPCSSCHGFDGAGGSEGNIRIASIAPSALDAPTTRRPAYDENAFIRAVREGTDPAGRSLDPAMPRFELADGDGRALYAFLRTNAVIERRGLEPDRIVIGVDARDASPSARQSLLAGVRAAWKLRGDRRIWGRKIEFELVDSKDNLFAILFPDHGLKPVRTDGPYARTPLLFPLRGAVAGPFMRGMNADEVDQIRALIEAAGEEAPILVDDVARAFLVRHRLHAGRSLVDTPDMQPAARRLLVIGAPGSLSRWLGHIATSTELFMPFDDAIQIKVVGAGKDRLIRTADPRPVSSGVRAPDQERMLSVAAYLVEEALARGGRDITRSEFLRALSNLKLEEAIWPRLDYARNRQTGSREARFLKFEEINLPIQNR